MMRETTHVPPYLQLENVIVDSEQNLVTVMFTPTIPHCSMATLIGLCIRVKLLRSLPRRLKVCRMNCQSPVLADLNFLRSMPH